MPPNSEGEQQSRQQETEQVKDVARAEIAQAKQAGQQENLRNALLQELTSAAAAAQTVKETVRTVTEAARAGRDESVRLRTNEIQAASKNVTKSILRVLEAVKEGIITPPPKTQVVLNKLAGKVIGGETASHLHSMITKYLDRDISFSQKGQTKTPFETDFDQLKNDNPLAAQLLYESLIQVSREGETGLGVPEDEIREKFEITRERFGEREPSYEAQELVRIMEKYPPEDHKLLEALFMKDKFEPYVQDLHDEIVKKLEQTGERAGLSEAQFEEKVNKRISSELKERITMIVGKLYQKTDESSPEEFWEKKEQEGGIFYSVQVQLDSLRRQIDRLGKIPISEGSILNRIKFYREKDESFDLRVPTEKGEEVRHFVKPFRRQIESNFQEYFLTVYNTVNDEINIRKFLHNSRALPYHPPGEGGYYGQLANYAEELLPSSSIDILAHLPDASETLAASQLWDKLYEADFAKYNWVHQPSRGALDPELKLTVNDQETLSYLKLLNPDLQKDEWRAKRALIMAIGDNYSISMRALETGAYADAPVNIDQKGKEGGAVYTSYDKRDSAIYKVFNPLAHENLRWQVEMMIWGNLLFLPVSGKKLGKAGAWDHRELMKEMQKNMKEYLEGRTSEDEKNEVVRFANLINPGKVGSIYTRGGWRNFYTYEGFLVHERDDVAKGVKRGQRVDALTGWKRVENIGVEVLKDYFPRIGDLYSKDFYKPEGRSEREALVRYVYKKYIDPSTTDDTINGEIQKLEADPDKTKDNYTNFYWRILSNALLQRAPTKLIRLERNRFVSGRKRGWEEIRIQTKLDETVFDTAVKDICAAEVLLRKQITGELKKGISGGRNLDQVEVNYNLTSDTLRRYLSEIMKLGEGRVDSAMKVYGKIKEFNEENIGAFIEKYKDKERGFPFAIAVEELERSLLAHKGAGERVPARALGDINAIEKNVSNSILQLFTTIRQTSIDGKKDFSEIVKLIGKAQEQMDAFHGREASQKLAHHMAAVSIAFFKKDTAARELLGIFGTGKRNSLAAEFAGRSGAVWEWDSREIDAFCTTLETAHILPKIPYEIQKTPTYEPVMWEVPILKKKIKLPFERKKPDYTYYGNRLRKEFGGDWKSKSYDLINKYIPIFLAVLLYYYIQKSFKEWFEKQR